MMHLCTRSSVELRTLRDTIRAFLQERYAGQQGQYWLGSSAGNPTVEPMHTEWYELPRQANAIINRYVELAELGCNLYCAACLFSARRRVYANALPSPWLWLDDAAIDGAELVETSAGNFQSWLKLDQPLSAEERSALQRAIRDASDGADSCSADAVHPARLPGGWNRKRHGAFRVQVARPADRVFRVADLRERFPQAIQPEGLVGDAEYEHGSDLSDDTVLAESARFCRLREVNSQLHTVCAGEAIALPMKNGRMDASRSNQRAVFVNQLLRAKYPHNEIRALAKHFQSVLESEPKWFEADIDRLLRPVAEGGYTPNDYKPEATRGTRPVEAAPRGGRHYELTAGELLEQYHACADSGPRGIVLDWTINDAADHMRVSTGTIKRREAEAIRAGLIRREYGRVILSPTTWEMGSQRIETPQAINSDVAEPIGSQRIGSAQATKDATSEAIEAESTLPIGSQGIASPQTLNDSISAPIGSETTGADADAEYILLTGQCEERARAVEITHTTRWSAHLHTAFAGGAVDDAAGGAAELCVLNAPACSSPGQTDMPGAGILGGCVLSAAIAPEIAIGVPDDRDLLTAVRTLAKEAAEPGWVARDYVEWASGDLLAEVHRLQAYLWQRDTPWNDAGESAQFVQSSKAAAQQESGLVALQQACYEQAAPVSLGRQTALADNETRSHDPFWDGIEEELAAFIPPPSPEPRIREWSYGEMYVQAAMVQERYMADQRERRAEAPPRQVMLDLPIPPADAWPAWIWGWDDPPAADQELRASTERQTINSTSERKACRSVRTTHTFSFVAHNGGRR